MNLHTVSVNRMGQLEVGAYYLIVGSDSEGVPSPPQVFRLEKMTGPPTVVGYKELAGTLWVRAFGQTLTISDFNTLAWRLGMRAQGDPAPEEDVHLERVLEPEKALRQWDYRDVKEKVGWQP